MLQKMMLMEMLIYIVQYAVTKCLKLLEKQNKNNGYVLKCLLGINSNKVPSMGCGRYSIIPHFQSSDGHKEVNKMAFKEGQSQGLHVYCSMSLHDSLAQITHSICQVVRYQCLSTFILSFATTTHIRYTLKACRHIGCNNFLVPTLYIDPKHRCDPRLRGMNLKNCARVGDWSQNYGRTSSITGMKSCLHESNTSRAENVQEKVQSNPN